MIWLRLILAAAILGANGGAMYLLERYFSPEMLALPDHVFADFPLTLGSWRGEEASLDPELFRATGAVEMVSRIYRNAWGGKVASSVGVWSKYTVLIPHSPVVCYPAAGWTLLDKRDINLDLLHEQGARARLVTYKRHGERTMVLFWAHVGDRVFLDKHGMRQFRVGLRMKESSVRPLIKVTLATSTSATDYGDAEARLRELANAVFPLTREIATVR